LHDFFTYRLPLFHFLFQHLHAFTSLKSLFVCFTLIEF
jgi:hypothetical protein